MAFERILVLIDGDNVAAAQWPAVSGAITRLGSICRALAARNASGGGWQNVQGVDLELLPYMVRNGVDFHLAIRLGEVLAAERPDAVAIVTSDSDFEALLFAVKQRQIGAIAVAQLRDDRTDWLSRLARSADICVVLPPAERRLAFRPTPPSPSYTALSASASGLVKDRAAVERSLTRLDGSERWIQRADLNRDLSACGSSIPRKRLNTVLISFPDRFECNSDKTQIRLLPSRTDDADDLVSAARQVFAADPYTEDIPY